VDHPESPDHPELVFRLRAVPAAVFVDLLRQAGEALDARALKARLEGCGVARDVVDAAWRRAQPGVKRHANIAVDPNGRYAWSDTPVPREPIRSTPTEALERILRGRLPAGVKADLAELVLRALRERDVLEQQARATYEGAREARAALERQLRIDAVRLVAELAAEVEELAGHADTGVLVERVRALAKAFDLDPIGRAGDQAAFDPLQHEPIGGTPLDGTSVLVIRPGYSWRAGPHAVLLGKAQVTGV
jgi:hypothetical protein